MYWVAKATPLTKTAPDWDAVLLFKLTARRDYPLGICLQIFIQAYQL